MFLTVFDRLAPAAEGRRAFLLDRFAQLYVVVAIPLVVYTSVVHRLVFGKGRLEFLPLMFMSSYSALGVVGSWIGFSFLYFVAS